MQDNIDSSDSRKGRPARIELNAAEWFHVQLLARPGSMPGAPLVTTGLNSFIGNNADQRNPHNPHRLKGSAAHLLVACRDICSRACPVLAGAQ
jgi:hypothetical protein